MATGGAVSPSVCGVCRGRKRWKCSVVVLWCVLKALARTMSLGFYVLAVAVNAVCAQGLTSLMKGSESLSFLCATALGEPVWKDMCLGSFCVTCVSHISCMC